jgi:sirohydrochlorin cobaltochelatase
MIELILMPYMEKPGIVLAPYGSLYPRALATYEQIRAAYGREFPGSRVILAFTSQFMAERLFENKGIRIPGPLAALAELHEIGCRSAVVQSLQIVPGEEFHELAKLVQALEIGGKLGFERLEIGLPLLSSLEDCKKVSSALPAVWKRDSLNGEPGEISSDPEKEAVLLVGHGTGHPADSLYSLMAQVLKKNHTSVFLGTVEGFPGLSELSVELKGIGPRIKKVRLLPFLLVAGGHAEKDIAGDDTASWKSTLIREGFEVETHLRGMGESPEIISIFIEHTRKAQETAENRGQSLNRVRSKK